MQSLTHMLLLKRIYWVPPTRRFNASGTSRAILSGAKRSVLLLVSRMRSIRRMSFDMTWGESGSDWVYEGASRCGKNRPDENIIITHILIDTYIVEYKARGVWGELSFPSADCRSETTRLIRRILPHNIIIDWEAYMLLRRELRTSKAFVVLTECIALHEVYVRTRGVIVSVRMVW
mgnify:CR=1 FL=1